MHVRILVAAAGLLLGSDALVQAQQDYGTRLGARVGDRHLFRASGVHSYMEALDPAVQRWYLGPVHFSQWGRQQWEYTNWASRRQQRYVDAALEGDYYYDFFGDRITQGWIVYDWRQTQPVISEASRVGKASRYANWFNRLVLAQDLSGGRGFSIILGDEIRTTLTPMTFSKAGFNGLMTEYSAGRFHATGLFSRISRPMINAGTGVFQTWTNLAAGRATTDVTDFMTFGVTFVNAHHGTGSAEAFEGNAFKGILNAEQLSERLDLLVLRLADDSPEDGEGGAILFSDDIDISLTLMRGNLVDGESVVVETDTVLSANSVGFRPVIEGGKLQQGFLTADGAEDIVMKYFFSPGEGQEESSTLRAKLQQHLDMTLDEAENTISTIKNVRFRLVLANDYLVEMSSNRQTDLFGVPQFRMVTRADGNIKNQLNQREVVFDYGIPTANQIFGFTTEIRDFHGVDLYGEVNINTEYRKYPAISQSKHKDLSGIKGDRNSLGWMANFSWKNGPWAIFGEGFGMDDAYSTSIKPLREKGTTDYSPEATNLLYDYVDDNDDNDRHPDQLRVGEGSLIPQRGFQRASSIEARGTADPEVFPGYDENGDLISDFNQNNLFDRRNYFPDYDEPFLRYHSDRPEFLFGMDLNNNGWVDRFENDDEPDYPYKKDHWGYNLYGGAEITPSSKFRVGQLRQEMKKSERENTTTYIIASLDQDWVQKGRLRMFDMLKRTKDGIPDHIVQWVIPRAEFGLASESSGRLEAINDPLAAADTWINTLYCDWQYKSRTGWSTFHRLRWETWNQQNVAIEYQVDENGDRVLEDGEPVVLFDPLGPDQRNGRKQSGFFGIINKLDHVFHLGSLRIDPRYKSEYSSETPFRLDEEKRKAWDSLFFLQLSLPVFRATVAQIGVEQRFYVDLMEDQAGFQTGQLTGDFRGSVLAFQLTNRSEYLGYQLTMQTGIRVDRRSLEVADGDRETRISGLSFMSIFAGLR